MSLFRTTIRLAAVMAVAGAALVATPQPAPGCSCTRTAILSEYADEVEVAFTGRQIERVEPDGTAIGAAKVALILEVDRVYRGRTGPLISVLTNFGGGNCGIDFSREGLVAVAPALRQDNDLEVALCGSQYAISDFQAVFGPGYPPDETMTQTLEQMEKSARDTVNHLIANRDYVPAREPVATEWQWLSEEMEAVRDYVLAREPVATATPPPFRPVPRLGGYIPAREPVATTIPSAEPPPPATDDAPTPELEKPTREPIATTIPSAEPPPPATDDAPTPELEKPTREPVATTVLSAQPPPSATDAPAPGSRAPTVALLIGTAAAVLAVGAVVLLRVRRSSEDRRR